MNDASAETIDTCAHLPLAMGHTLAVQPLG